MRTLVLSSALFVMVSGLAQAQTIWNGATDLNWSTATNWTPATVPGTGATAQLDDTGADRSVIYDTAASGALGGLTINQTSAFLNEVDVRKNLTITDAVNLSATGGGTSQISVDSTGSSRKVTFTGGLTVGSGGKLSLGFASAGAGVINYSPSVAGNVTLGGGVIAVGGSVGPTSSTSVTANFDNDLTITGGVLSVDTINTTTTDIRVAVGGNLTATGGSFSTTSGAAGAFQLSGVTNSFSNFTFQASSGITLMRNGDQTVNGLPALSGPFVLRGTGIKTVSGTTLGRIQFQGSGAVNTNVGLKLGSNLAQGNSQRALYMAGGAGGTSTLSVDANGYTFDMSQVSTTVQAGTGTGGVWKPNSTIGTVTWALSSSAANGVIKARGFDFTDPTVTGGITVGADLTLESTGGASGVANNLGSGTALDVASTFKYSGGSGTTTLTSGRNIGTLLVSSGTLQTTGTTFQAAGGIRIASGAKLDFATVALTAPTLTMDINGATAGQLLTSTAGGFTYTGNALTLNFATAVADPSTFDLLSFTVGQTPTGHLTSLALTGFYTGALLDADLDGIWTGSAGDRSFSFSQATGDLSVVPEPATWALLAGAGTFLMVMRRRRRE